MGIDIWYSFRKFAGNTDHDIFGLAMHYFGIEIAHSTLAYRFIMV